MYQADRQPQVAADMAVVAVVVVVQEHQEHAALAPVDLFGLMAVAVELAVAVVQAVRGDSVGAVLLPSMLQARVREQ
jgi:hypothetical protein